MRLLAPVQRKQKDWPALTLACSDLSRKEFLLVVFVELPGRMEMLGQELVVQMVRPEQLVVARKVMPEQPVAGRTAMVLQRAVVQTVMLLRLVAVQMGMLQLQLVGYRKAIRSTVLPGRMAKHLIRAASFVRSPSVQKQVYRKHFLAVRQRLLGRMVMRFLGQRPAQKLVSVPMRYQHRAKKLGQIQMHQRRVSRKHL
jgi:hypothetical protein